MKKKNSLITIVSKVIVDGYADVQTLTQEQVYMSIKETIDIAQDIDSEYVQTALVSSTVFCNVDQDFAEFMIGELDEIPTCTYVLSQFDHNEHTNNLEYYGIEER